MKVCEGVERNIWPEGLGKEGSGDIATPRDERLTLTVEDQCSGNRTKSKRVEGWRQHIASRVEIQVRISIHLV